VQHHRRIVAEHALGDRVVTHQVLRGSSTTDGDPDMAAVMSLR